MNDTTPTAAPIATPTLAAAATAELKDWGLLTEATGHEMHTWGATLWEDGNGAEAGIWECTPGPSRWLLTTHEFIHVLAGRMTVTTDDGDVTELSAGDIAMFPKGWSGTWNIHEKLRKLYSIF